MFDRKLETLKQYFFSHWLGEAQNTHCWFGICKILCYILHPRSDHSTFYIYRFGGTRILLFFQNPDTIFLNIYVFLRQSRQAGCQVIFLMTSRANITMEPSCVRWVNDIPFKYSVNFHMQDGFAFSHSNLFHVMDCSFILFPIQTFLFSWL